MPSASVSTATRVNAGRRLQLPQRNRHVVSDVVEPLCQSHLAISLSAKVLARPFELPEVADARQHDLARDLRIHPALDELARAHLDVEGELFVDLLVERHAPQPRAERASSSWSVPSQTTEGRKRFTGRSREI